MSRARKKVRESIASRVQEAVAQRKLEPEQGALIHAALERVFHSEAVKDTKARDKALNELCGLLLRENQ